MKKNALDPQSVLASAANLPAQIKQAWEEGLKMAIDLPASKPKNLVVAGMGGSALGARVITSVFGKELTLPWQIVNDYHLPGFVDKHSLVILSSYSGNTEEILACAKEAYLKKSLVLAVTTGGKLASLAKKRHWPCFLLQETYNPSGKPRMGLGASIAAQLALLKRLQVLNLDAEVMAQGTSFLQKNEARIKAAAKSLALSLCNKIPILVSSRHLRGSVYVFKNTLNENSKTFSASFALPELNHHLLEGLRFPSSNPQNLVFVFFQSDLYEAKIKKRMTITQEVVAKNKVSFLTFKPLAPTALGQALEAIFLGSFASVFLAFAENTDPGPIPWVDYFKEKLAAHEKEK